MSRPLRLEHEGALWHVTSRGNERRVIFLDRNDKATFVEILGATVIQARWRLHAYVLMRNHYHLLVETPEQTLSWGAKQLNQRWAEHFNWRHDRVGHLFQGRFKAILVERETHLLELVRYIVLNPVRCGAVAQAADYEWSNYRATAGLDPRPHWLEIEWTLSQFDTDRNAAKLLYRRFVDDARGAAYRPWDSLTGDIYLGSAEFCERIQRKVDVVKGSSEIPARQRQVAGASFDTLMNAACRVFGETPQSMCAKNRRPAKKALAHLARTMCFRSYREIGDLLGTNDTSAANLAAQGARLEKSDPKFRAALERVRELSGVRSGNPT